MMCVMDCSYVLAVIAPDEPTPASAGDVLAMDLVAPWLWATEIASAALRIERRKRFPGASAQQLCAAAESLGIAAEPAGGRAAPSSPTARLKLALAHHLTSYDAAYIELALQQGIPIATQDARVISAAERVGIPVYS